MLHVVIPIELVKNIEILETIRTLDITFNDVDMQVDGGAQEILMTIAHMENEIQAIEVVPIVCGQFSCLI